MMFAEPPLPDSNSLTYFAKLNHLNEVVQVLVIDQQQVDTGAWGDPKLFVQTCPHTRGNVHLQGGTPLRKNAAAIGHVYDPELDAFIEPKPFESWWFDKEKCQWFPPVWYPADYGEIDYYWDEAQQQWIRMPGQFTITP